MAPTQSKAPHRFPEPMTESLKTQPSPGPQPPQIPSYYPVPYPSFPSHTEEETSLLDYWRVIWGGKWFIIFLCFLSGGAAAWYSYSLPKIYQAETSIISMDAGGGGGLASALSATPFAGALGGSLLSAPFMDRMIALIESRTMAERVIRRLDLMPVLFSDEWDSAKKGWKEGAELPTMQNASKDLGGMIEANIGSRGTVVLTVEFRDPKMAASIANAYISALSEYLNEHAINVNFQVLDMAVPPEKKSKPNVRLNVLLAGVGAFFLGCLIVFVREFVRKSHEKKSKTDQSFSPA